MKVWVAGIGLLLILSLGGCGISEVAGSMSNSVDEVVSGDGYKNVYPPGMVDGDGLGLKEKRKSSQESSDNSILSRIERRIWGD